MKAPCITCRYLQTYGCTDNYYCSAQKETPRIYDPDIPCICDMYQSMMKKEETRRENMVVSPFKEVPVPKTVFNKDYWKVGDAYVIKTPNTKPKFYVLEEVVEMSHVRMDNGVTLSPEDFNIGGCELINHISLDYACSKSMVVE